LYSNVPLNFVCEFREKKKGELWKKGSGRSGVLWKGRALGNLFFFIMQNPSNLGKLIKCIVGLWRA
jgi:hypothetical protein